MQGNRAGSLPPQLACALITAYQRVLSPLKGFSCAFRVLHGRQSCSQYAKRVVGRYGLPSGLRLLRRRFARCHMASQVLDYEAKRDKRSRRHKWRQRASNYCDTGGCPGDACWLGAEACDCGDALNCW